MATYIYIIALVFNGEPCSPVKVGVAQDPSRRLRALQTATPYELCIAKLFQLPTRQAARFVEKMFHKCQPDQRMRGEWFDINPKAACELVALDVATAIKTSGLNQHEIKSAADAAGVGHLL